MLKKTVIPICICLLSFTIAKYLAAADSKPPLTIGGFTLGRSINEYSFTSKEAFVKEVVVTDIKGFRKGFITYGVCENPGKILRIKLKYHDKSAAFFEQLIKQYKKKFPAKPKFTGDSFGRVKSWKWTFADQNGERLTLLLQHNLKDEDETTGSMVKLSLPDQIIAERRCSNRDSLQPQGGDRDTSILSDWDIFLPE